MDNNKIFTTESAAGFLEHIIVLLRLALEEIKQKYADYPLHVVEYEEEGNKLQSIEIRFEEQESTIICSLNSDGLCSEVYLFPDTEDRACSLVDELIKGYKYEAGKDRWIAGDAFVRIKQMSDLPDDICLIFYI